MINSTYFPFGPFLWLTKIDKQIVDDLLSRGSNCILDHNEKLAGHIEKEKTFSQNDREWFVKVMNCYFVKYLQEGEQFYKKDLEGKKYKLQLESLWINYMIKNEFNPEHVHGGFLSFVLYLQIPESLKEENLNNRTTSGGAGSIDFSYGEPHRNTITCQNIFPEVGDLLIFPSSLRHSVYPFKSEGTRISVSGNFSLQYYE